MILVMPLGSTGSFTDEEWANKLAARGWETLSRATSSTQVDARFRTIRSGGRALAGFSEGGYGALELGMHHPGEFRVLESWSGYELADAIGSIFGPHRAAARTAGQERSVAEPRSAPGTHYDLVLHGTGDAKSHRTGVCAAAQGPRAAPPVLVVRSSHNWALWRGNAPRAPTWPLERARRARRAPGPPVRVLVLFAATGWLYLVQRALPGPGSGDALPLDELARHSPARSSVTSSCWGAAGADLGSMPAGRGWIG